jgi:hypothetical protein
VDWVHLAQERDRWRPLVNIVMNLRFQYKAGNVLLKTRRVRTCRRAYWTQRNTTVVAAEMLRDLYMSHLMTLSVARMKGW